MHTELSRLIAGCCNHTTSAAAPYRKGFTTELRMIALFDGGIERIHVDVQYLADRKDGVEQRLGIDEHRLEPDRLEVFLNISFVELCHVFPLS